jgi:WD40 repeat protein/serine/threonine protein kinase
MNDLAGKAKAIFLDAIEKYAPEQWACYLDEACGGDGSLRARVDKLLRARAQLGSFHETPEPAPGATTDEPLTERPGTMIGSYKLLQQIGEGGMGVVYMAEQQQPVRRKVALKIIKPGMDSAQVIARFEAERQALALMDHQNIAKVFDAGTTQSSRSRETSDSAGTLTSSATGRPYFVMELVHGVPITQYCDDHHLTPKERLGLFLPVCHAIQHAHQKGIIHRDLKPSNVLVCLYDGVPVPKVIDFGIAKATGPQLTERTMFTQFGTLVGTLEYMSPEQAEMSQLGIDTRSDVYSLGVLLYELVTGTTPLERHRLREAGFDEIRRLIREEEPPKPSTRLSTSGIALAAISAQRQTEPAKLTRLVRGELDWIIMKALEKDRNRRYESANSLARDVERYLHDEPVEACPPTAGYKLRKFARKHKAGLATAVGFAALLMLGTVISASQAVRATQAEAVANANAVQAQEKEYEANQQRNDAQQQRDLAQRQRDEARTLNEKLQAALEQVKSTQAELRSTLYASHINLAQHAWEAGGVGRVLELLEQHRPKPGESDLRSFEWYYLYRLCHSDLFTLKGHTGRVSSVAYSPDGNRLASGAYDETVKAPAVKVWDAQTGKELLSLKVHASAVSSVAFSPDGKSLASGTTIWDNTKQVDDFGEVEVWDAQTGQVLLTLKGHTGGVQSVAFSPDGKRLASGSKGPDWNGPGEVKVWDAKTGRELLSLKGHLNIHSVVFSPDGKLLASAAGRDTVKVWDAQTARELLTLKSGARSVAFSPDGKRLASAAMDNRVKVWDAQTGQELLTLKGHNVQINSVAFSPDGKRLASAAMDNRVKVWDAQTGKELLTFQGHTGPVSSVVFSPDGTRLATGARDGVKIWDATTSPEAPTFSARNVRGVVFSPDGKRLAGGSYDETLKAPALKVWDAQTGHELLSLKGHASSISSVAFSPDGKRLASGSGTWDATKRAFVSREVKLWDAQTGQELLTLKGHSAAVVSVAFSPDGKRLASGSGDDVNRYPPRPGEVKVWDAQTGQELLSFQGGRSVAFSPNGKRLASASGEGVKVWDAQTGQEILTLRVRTGGAVAFSPDGKRLASNSYLRGSGEIKVWDAQTGKELLTPQGHTALVWSVAFSPDGKRLTSSLGGPDGEVKVWDAQTGQELLTLKGGGIGSSVAFSPDGHRLASSANVTVTIYDATPLPEKP